MISNIHVKCRVCYSSNFTPRVGGAQVDTPVSPSPGLVDTRERDQVGNSWVYPITLRSSLVGIPPTKYSYPWHFMQVSCTRGRDLLLRLLEKCCLVSFYPLPFTRLEQGKGTNFTFTR